MPAPSQAHGSTNSQPSPAPAMATGARGGLADLSLRDVALDRSGAEPAVKGAAVEDKRRLGGVLERRRKQRVEVDEVEIAGEGPLEG